MYFAILSLLIIVSNDSTRRIIVITTIPTPNWLTHHITSHGEDGCRPQWPLYPRNKYLYTTLLLTSI